MRRQLTERARDFNIILDDVSIVSITIPILSAGSISILQSGGPLGHQPITWQPVSFIFLVPQILSVCCSA